MTTGIITFTDGATVTQELDKWGFLPDTLKRRAVSAELVDEYFSDLIKAQLFEDFKQVMPTGEVKQLKSIELLTDAPYKKAADHGMDFEVIKAKNAIRKEELLERQRQREAMAPYITTGLVSSTIPLWLMMS